MPLGVDRPNLALEIFWQLNPVLILGYIYLQDSRKI